MNRLLSKSRVDSVEERICRIIAWCEVLRVRRALIAILFGTVAL